jgi:hypothetical protein
VLNIIVPIFCVVGSVASYRRTRQHRAMLLPSELLNVFAKSSLSCVLATGHLSAVFDLLRTLSSVRSSLNSSAIWQEERIPSEALARNRRGSFYCRQSAKRRSEKPEVWHAKAGRGWLILLAATFCSNLIGGYRKIEIFRKGTCSHKRRSHTQADADFTIILPILLQY